MIININERGNALKELLMSLDDLTTESEESNSLRDKIKGDIEKTYALYKKWWDNISKKYNLDLNHNKYDVNFIANEIIVLKES